MEFMPSALYLPLSLVVSCCMTLRSVVTFRTCLLRSTELTVHVCSKADTTPLRQGAPEKGCTGGLLRTETF